MAKIEQPRLQLKQYRQSEIFAIFSFPDSLEDETRLNAAPKYHVIQQNDK
jgi:hypothetical protein